MSVLLLIFKLWFITCLIEGLLALTFIPHSKWLMASVLVNTVTNPLLNCALLLVITSKLIWLYYCILILGEFIVLFTEAFLYKKMMVVSFKKAFFISLLLNSISVLLGFVVF